MSKEFKAASNNLQSFSTTGPKGDKNKISSSCKCRSTNSNQKDEGNNEWSSVPVTYDKEESTHKHEKSETNNQWTSTSK